MRRPAAIRRPKSDPKRTIQARAGDRSRAYLRQAKWQGLVPPPTTDDSEDAD